MAKQEQAWDWNESHPSQRRHDWTALLDGNIWRLSKYFDFDDIQAMRSQVHQAAKRHGVKVRTTKSGNDLIIQAIRNKGN